MLLICASLLATASAFAERTALAQLEAEQQSIFDSVSKSVVFIANKQGFGSGFYVSEFLVLTNAHVVGDASEVNVIVRGGVRAKGQVVARDKDTDLALVQLKVKGLPVHLAPTSSVRVGSWVAAVGHGEGGIWSFTTGMVSNVYVRPKKSAVIQTQIPINFGNSGGPVVNRSGEVVGVVTSKSSRGENLNFAIPVDAAIERLAQLRTECASCLRVHAKKGAQVFVAGRLVGQGPVVVVAASKGKHEVLVVDGPRSRKQTVTVPRAKPVKIQ